MDIYLKRLRKQGIVNLLDYLFNGPDIIPDSLLYHTGRGALPNPSNIFVEIPANTKDTARLLWKAFI